MNGDEREHPVAAVANTIGCVVITGLVLAALCFSLWACAGFPGVPK